MSTKRGNAGELLMKMGLFSIHYFASLDADGTCAGYFLCTQLSPTLESTRKFAHSFTLTNEGTNNSVSLHCILWPLPA